MGLIQRLIKWWNAPDLHGDYEIAGGGWEGIASIREISRKEGVMRYTCGCCHKTRPLITEILCCEPCYKKLQAIAATARAWQKEASWLIGECDKVTVTDTRSFWSLAQLEAEKLRGLIYKIRDADLEGE